MSFEPRPLKWPPIFPLEKGLVLWLPFDDRSGTRTYDRSGKANHGTLYGPTWVAGRRGSALSFDGVDDYVKVPNTSALFNSFDNKTELTVSLWVKLLTAPSEDRYFIQFGDAAFIISCSSARLVSFWIRDHDGAWHVISIQIIDLNTWYFLSFTYDGTIMRCYVNGVEITTSTFTNTLGPYASDNVIGALLTNQGYINAIVDEVRIYNRALTAAEVKRLYESEIILTRW